MRNKDGGEINYALKIAIWTEICLDYWIKMCLNKFAFTFENLTRTVQKLGWQELFFQLSPLGTTPAVSRLSSLNPICLAKAVARSPTNNV